MRFLHASICLTFLVGGCTSGEALDSASLFQENCASCHGSGEDGGTGGDLFDGNWTHGGDLASIRKNITAGIETAGMPPFEGGLSAAEIEALVAYVKAGKSEEVVEAAEETVETAADTPEKAAGLVSAIDQVEGPDIEIAMDDFVTGLDEPWGFEFLDDNSLLITEKKGKLWMVSGGDNKAEITGIPTVNSGRQGGLLDVATDPDYAENKWIYLTFSHPLKGKSGPSMTKLIRGKIVDNQWINEETLFQAQEDDYLDTGFHYGSRITFDDKGHLFFSIGDRGPKEMAQDTDRPNGKIHRVNRDGSIPADNPYMDAKYPSIYSYGNRNPQGLIWHPDTGVLWETEHGPRGGDELNAINAGKNYGWPEISYGINYNGTILTPHKSLPGMEQPVSQWTPSIAVCGLDVYTGDLFPEWKGRLLAGSLAFQSLRLIDVNGESYVGELEILKDKGKIRDVTTGPDGAIYVALPRKIVRLSPQ